MSTRPARSVGRVVPLLVVGASVVAVLALGAQPGSERPLDPRSDERLGTSALVALARELGADVDVSNRLPGEDSDADVVLLLADLLDDDGRRELEAWVDDGGTLVVVDPASTFAPDRDALFLDMDDLAGQLGRPPSVCEIDPLDGVDTVGVEPRNGGVLFDLPMGSESCVGDGRSAYIVATPSGEGTVVAIGGSGLLVNAALAEGENAPVIAALVAPQEQTNLVVLEPAPLAGSGRRSLIDLVSSNVWWALAQAAIAFLIYVLWRSRRLGAPVAESQPVAVAGSELVAAVGALLDRTGSTQHAADLLRADLRRFLADHLGVPPDAPPDVVTSVAGDRTAADPAQVASALGPSPVTDEAQLVALAKTIDAVREEVLDHV